MFPNVQLFSGFSSDVQQRRATQELWLLDCHAELGQLLLVREARHHFRNICQRNDGASKVGDARQW